MGDRVSIRFVSGNPESAWMNETVPTLFSHWGGMEFAREAQQYADDLTDTAAKSGGTYPLDRLEPETVTVDFIYQMGRRSAHGERVDSDLYLAKTPDDGDNSDNGHFDIVLGRPADQRTTIKLER